MKFTTNDLKAMQSDARSWASIDFTLHQLSDLLKRNQNNLATLIWEDFEQVGHPSKYGLDTAVRDIFFDLIGVTYTGLHWPLNGNGPAAGEKFFKKLKVGLTEADIKHGY